MTKPLEVGVFKLFRLNKKWSTNGYQQKHRSHIFTWPSIYILNKVSMVGGLNFVLFFLSGTADPHQCLGYIFFHVGARYFWMHKFWRVLFSYMLNVCHVLTFLTVWSANVSSSRSIEFWESSCWVEQRRSFPTSEGNEQWARAKQ